MRGGQDPVSDEDLHAFVDGEISADRIRAIETHLAASPADAERVAVWRRQKELLRASFARLAAEPAPAAILLPAPARKCAFLRAPGPIGERPRAESVPGRLWRMSATPLAVSAVFAAGAVAGLTGAFFANGAHPPPVTGGEAALPHAAQADIPAERTIAALLAFTPQEGADASGAPLRRQRPASPQATLIVPNLSGVGLTLVGVGAAPALSTGLDDHMFCLFYAKAAAATVALCIAPDNNGGGARGFHAAGQFPNGVGAAISWRQANAVYVLAGPLTAVELRNLANRVSAEVGAFD